MAGGIKTSIKTYRETLGTLLGTEYTSFKLNQIEYFFVILLNLLLAQAEKKTSQNCKSGHCHLQLSPGQLNSAVQH